MSISPNTVGDARTVTISTPVRVAVATLPRPDLLVAFDGIRQALGAPTERIPPHCTIAPPAVTDDLAAAVEAMRTVAAQVSGPAPVVIGPAATFLPATRTIHLSVDDRRGVLADLEAALRIRAPFDRPRDRPFVPHVTLHPSAPAAVDVDAVVAALPGQWSSRFERITLLVAVGHGADLRWTPIADSALGPIPVVGRGGLEWSLAESGLVPLGIDSSPTGSLTISFGGDAATGVVVTARGASGAIAGVAAGHVVGSDGILEHLGVDPEAQRLGVVDHLLAAWEVAARRRDASRLRTAPALSALGAERNWWAET